MQVPKFLSKVFLTSKNAPLIIGGAIGALLVALVAILVVFAVQVTSLSAKIEQRNEMLLAEIRNNTSDIDFLKQNIELLAQDSNSVRGSLHLPPQPYPVLAPPAPPTESGDSTESAFLAGFDTILRQRDRDISAAKYQALLASPLLAGTIRSGGFTSEQTGSATLVLRKNGRLYYTITVNPSSKTIQVSDFLGSQLNILELNSRFTDFVGSRTPVLDAHFAKLAAAVAEFSKARNDPYALSLLSAHELTLSPVTEALGSYSFRVLRGGDPVLTVKLDERSLAVSEGSKRYARVSDFVGAFARDLGTMDLRAPLERKVDASRAEIEALSKDKSFMSLLAERHIRLSHSPREDGDYFYYDFLDPDGKRIGSFAVEKKVGGIYLLDAQDVPISALQTATMDDLSPSKKKLTSGDAITFPTVPAPTNGSLNFLICGEHQGDTDTIMLAHADARSGRVVLISLPRDLYYKGRKINAIYHLFGPDELMREMSDITGLTISKYLVIDMYAFIDVVNIIGGIDLYLPYDLSDPTYRVRNNGVWSTLYYAKGWHHLDGIETLRIARSRHTSSDFARAIRQQSILGAIRARVDQVDLLDMSKLYDLIRVMMKYVDTNFTPLELASYFREYKDAPFLERNVLDMNNVLYQSWSNTYYLPDKGLSLGADFDKGAWILLPKHDDWNTIRLYIRTLIQGE